MRCVSYIGRQAWEGYGQENMKASVIQKECIDEYIKKRGEMAVRKRYTDFERLISDGITGKYECVIFASVIYCGSCYKDAKNMIADILYQAGIRFVIADDDVDSGMLKETELNSYLENKKRLFRSYRMKKLSEKNTAGYILSGSVPYGYIKSAKNGQPVKDEEVSCYLKEIFDRAISGESAKDIALFLNERKADTPLVHKKKRYGHDTAGLSSEWNESKVRRIINNPVYAGSLTDIKYEPYITEKEHEALTKRKRGACKMRAGKDERKQDNILSPYVYCKQKKRKLVCRKLKSADGYVFCCPARCKEAEKKVCRLPYEEVYGQVVKMIAEEKKLAKAAYQIIGTKRAADVYNMRKDDIRRRADKIIGYMKPGMRERVLLYEDYVSGKTDAEKYEKQLCEYRLRYRRYNDELEELFKERKRIDTLFSKINPWITLFMQPEEHKIKDIIERVEADTLFDGGIGVSVYFKYADWKEELMESVAKEEGYGEKEQEV